MFYSALATIELKILDFSSKLKVGYGLRFVQIFETASSLSLDFLPLRLDLDLKKLATCLLYIADE